MSSVASYHGLTMSAITKRYQKPYYMEQYIAADENCVYHGVGLQHQGVDRPVIVVVDAEASVVVPQRRLGVTGVC